MHRHDTRPWRHDHRFDPPSEGSERRTRLVVALTAVTMVVEVAAGLLYRSMALLADGWHMGTHVAALAIAVFAYRYARRHAEDVRFTFGTGKVGVLGGFASAVALAVVAGLMAVESVSRFFTRPAIRFDQALLVAAVGLAVNVASAAILWGGSAGGAAHEHGGAHEHGAAHDHNLKAAYLHVMADALTSVLAIVALSLGKLRGWVWLDPVMGIVGSVIVGLWAYGLVRDTSGILLDRTPESSDLPREIRRAVEGDGDSLLADLHVWQVAAGKFAAAVSIVAHAPKPVEVYRGMFHEHEELVHVTVEVRKCEEGEGLDREMARAAAA